VYNKVILIGNLVSDSQLLYTPNGKPINRFRIAVNTSINKEKQETLFIDCVCFNSLAENINPYLIKGQRVLVEGRLREVKWTSPDGQEKHKFEVITQNIRLLSFKQEQEEYSEHSYDDINEEEPF
jgi:single-strand DNA-binding protein